MNIFVRLLLVSCSCWFLFMGLDGALLLLYGLKYSSPSILPPLVLCCFIVVCYAAFAVFSGFFAGALCLALKFFRKDGQNFFSPVALAVCLASNCTVNLYVLHFWSIQLKSTAIAVGLCMLLLLIFSLVFLKLCERSNDFTSAVIAYSLAVGLFWVIARTGSKDILVQGSAGSMDVVYAVALLVGAALFFVLYRMVLPFLRRFQNTRQLPAALFLVFLLITCGYAGGEQQSVTHQSTRPNIVLIILDTLRFDNVSCYGYAKKTTPHIDRFAQESLLFKQAYATASWTLPSVASMLTGAYSGYHGAHRVNTKGTLFSSSGLSATNLTLAEVLGRNGYHTASFISTGFLGRKYGLDQGFHEIDDLISNYNYIVHSFVAVDFLKRFVPFQDYLYAMGYLGHRVADQINRLALDWIEGYKMEAPFFLLLHYFDPHHPYLPEKLGISPQHIPASVISRYGRRVVNYTMLERNLIYNVMDNKGPLLPDEHDMLINNYDLEISRTDQRVNTILETLKKRNIYDNSLIIIVSDHGESFGEHNLMLHGVSLYEDNLRVPLIMKFPARQQKKGVISKDVSLAGLAPTILSSIGIPVPETMQGNSFFSMDEQVILAQNFRDPRWGIKEKMKRFDQDLISLKQGKYKFIMSTGGTNELFHLEQDPLELNNLAEKEEEIAEQFSQHIAGYIETLGLLPETVEKVPSDVGPGTIQNLRALGYIR